MSLKHSAGNNIFSTKTVFQSASVLMGGTASAQLLLILTLPFITRIYAPADFGVFAVYTATVAILVIISSLRLEISLSLPKSDVVAVNLLVLALFSIICFLIIQILTIWLFNEQIVSALKEPRLDGMIWLVPITVVITATYSVLQYWASRQQRYKSTAYAQVAQAAMESGGQIAAGLCGAGAIGLIGGQLVSRAFAASWLAVPTYREIKDLLNTINIASLRGALSAYRRFPFYSTPDSLVNTAGLQLSIIMIAAFVDTSTAGMMFMAIKIMQLPVALLGAAVARVYLAELPAQIRQGSDTQMTRQVMIGLLDLAVGPIIFLGLASKVVLQFVLGDQWGMAGDIMAWMTPWVALQMLVSPVSMTLQVKNLAHISLLLNSLGLILRCLPILFMGIYSYQEYIPQVFTLFSALFYLTWLLVCMRYARVTLVEIFARLRPFIMLFLWIFLAIAVNYYFA